MSLLSCCFGWTLGPRTAPTTGGPGQSLIVPTDASLQETNINAELPTSTTSLQQHSNASEPASLPVEPSVTGATDQSNASTTSVEAQSISLEVPEDVTNVPSIVIDPAPPTSEDVLAYKLFQLRKVAECKGEACEDAKCKDGVHWGSKSNYAWQAKLSTGGKATLQHPLLEQSIQLEGDYIISENGKAIEFALMLPGTETASSVVLWKSPWAPTITVADMHTKKESQVIFFATSALKDQSNPLVRPVFRSNEGDEAHEPYMINSTSHGTYEACVKKAMKSCFEHALDKAAEELSETGEETG